MRNVRPYDFILEELINEFDRSLLGVRITRMKTNFIKYIEREAKKCKKGSKSLRGCRSLCVIFD